MEDVTESWKTLFANLFHVEEPGLLGCCAVWLGNCFSVFVSESVPPSVSVFWDPDFTHNPNNEGGRFLRNFGSKLPNHTTQQCSRLAAWTIRRWEPQITVFVLLIHFFLIIVSFSFIVFCWCMIDCLIFCERLKLPKFWKYLDVNLHEYVTQMF